MAEVHPELAQEQEYILHAYECLEFSKSNALKIRELTSSGPGGTFQARLERNVFDENIVHRLEQLDLGDAALVFGRIDRNAVADADAETDTNFPIETFHIGRLAVADENREPVVVDWRAPVAEPFYRATGREPMGLIRRRHFVVQGKELLALEDELFGDGHLGVGHDEGLGGQDPTHGLRGYSTLLTVLGRNRTGQLGDIVATIQSEQDEIIRSPQSGVLVVQGGPGTGKTVVALHRAAYLLYTHRFPLEDQGVLVIGPNRVFLRYIERVLPSLGEAGVEQVILADLVPDAHFGGKDSSNVARVKGQKKMSRMLDRAISDRERPLRKAVVLPYRTGFVTLSVEDSKSIIRSARRRFHRHNQGRRYVENEVWSCLAATVRGGDGDAQDVRDLLREDTEMRAVFEQMWPLLTPTQLLHDLFGSKALLRSAGNSVITESDADALYRARSESVEDVRWTNADAALLDEARFLLGPRPRRNGKIDDSDEIRTYGHIVVDEVQDLTPMQLRMVTRRSLSGAMTIVGDIAQATGPLAPNNWDDVLDYLPSRKEPRIVGLSVGYRIPAQIMELADKVMHAATPGLRAPRSVRDGDESPVIVQVSNKTELLAEVVARAGDLVDNSTGGRAAIICSDDMVEEISLSLEEKNISHGRAQAAGLDKGLSIVPASLVKGLELDDVIVVEPAAIVADDAQGLRLLYVTLTRSTRSLTVVHAMSLPDAMLG